MAEGDLVSPRPASDEETDEVVALCDAVMTLLRPWTEENEDRTVMALLIGVEVIAWINQENARRCHGDVGVKAMREKWEIMRANAKEVGMSYAESRRPEGF